MTKRWKVWREDETEEDAGEFAAKGENWWDRSIPTAEFAAEAWAEDDDSSSAEYSIVAQRDEPVVVVRDMKTGEITRWKVTGESVPQYSAKRLESEE